MEDTKLPICHSCGKTIETQTITEQGFTYCESCRPSQKHERTVALEPEPGDKIAESGATQSMEEKTVSIGKTEGESRSGERTQPTTMVTMSKSVSATKAIKDALHITPDVDLEHASKCYSSTRGKPSDAADAATITDLLSHADIESKYVFDKELGHGAMGAVLVMVDQDIRRKVAMKLMLRGGEATVGEIKRFLEEAQVTGQLEHPNIVPIHDIGIDDEAKIYYTMKLVRGETLESIIGKL
jgi:serine/threonine protein kinase